MIVIDASVLANAVGDDQEDGRTARREMASATGIAAPELIGIEATAVLRKRWIAGDVTVARFAAAIDALVVLPINRYPVAGLLRRVFELRDNVTPYDAVYVALAEALSAELLTGDARLAGAPGPRCDIRVLG